MRARNLSFVFGAVLATSALAQTGTGGTITDGDVIFTQGNSPSGTGGSTGTGPLADMKTLGASGADHVFQNWWWYRVEGVDTREFALADATSGSWVGNTGTINYTLPNFSAVLTYVVTDTGTNAGRVVTSLVVRNTTANPITVHLYNYHDFDLQPNLGDDQAILTGPNSIRVFDVGGTIRGQYIGTGASAYAVAAFATLRDLLTNTAVNTLGNTGLPFGPGDFTGAFQWDVTLAPDQSATVSATFALAPPPATGRCCIGSSCTIMSQEDCTAAHGVYGGDNSTCPSSTYQITTCDHPFEDISGTGTTGPVCDDCGVVVPLGFSFSFFGNSYSTIGLASNGYLTFGTTLGDLSNDPIPNVAVPNDLIAPFWDDLDPRTGSVKYQTLGSPGSQRFIAQWTNVPHFNSPTVLHTFQAVLFEGTNQIEFRYLLLPAIAGVVTPSVGIENSTGTIGNSIDPASLITPACRNFAASTPSNPCNVCPCDWNHDTFLNSQDFFDFLVALFNNNADFNNDGITNSQDFFDFLTCFFSAPPGC